MLELALNGVALELFYEIEKMPLRQILDKFRLRFDARTSIEYSFCQLMQNMATFHHSETACPHFSNNLLQSDKID